MSIAISSQRSTGARTRWSRREREQGERVPRSELPPLSPRLQVVRGTLVLLCALCASILLQLVIVSPIQQSAAQQRMFDGFRSQAAQGTAPIGPTTSDGKELPLGTPVAYLEIPEVGLKQVVGEGTTPAVLFDGPGHRRDSVLPGQVGTAVVFGRRAAYGGPFKDISTLDPADTITVTTGQGVFTFSVLGVRREGDPQPEPPAPGAARLLLVTADGRPFLPDGVIRVDAELDGEAVVGSARVRTPGTLPAQERVMAGDGRTLWALALWIQAMIVVTVLAVWAWHRWGRIQAWVVCFPVLLVVGLQAADQAARLLPNLL
jgi:hypothetical protein